MKKGLLIVVSGPSGVGKGTVLKQVLSNPANRLAYSISMTTRTPREGEVDGVNYYFVTAQRFQHAIENHELLEYAKFVDHYYGTPAAMVETMRNQGTNVLLEIDVQGAKQVMSRCPDALSIFITPPSMDELANRIRNRGSESETVIEKRLAKAKEEMKSSGLYDYVICNQDVNIAARSIEIIIQNHMKR